MLTALVRDGTNIRLVPVFGLKIVRHFMKQSLEPENVCNLWPGLSDENLLRTVIALAFLSASPCRHRGR